jgi:hypothetical protein
MSAREAGRWASTQDNAWAIIALTDWMTFTGDGGGGGGPMFKKLPDGMTEQQAYRRFIEALGYVHEGPWVFTVEINP